jgi:hypothetical protein
MPEAPAQAPKESSEVSKARLKRLKNSFLLGFRGELD